MSIERYATLADKARETLESSLGLIHVGTREVLLGDSARFAEKARRAGADVSLRVFDGMFHLFHQHWSLTETRAAHQDIAEFVTRTSA